ncbi:hypothetical protein V2J09_021068 [Rumex salicifolius]
MAAPFLVVMAATLALSLSLQHKCVEAKVNHHIVGNDRGWDPSTDVASWAASRAFLVGDSLWFTYSSAVENVVELRSEEEYETCDLSKPMRRYNDGLSKVSLEAEGIRYFSSGNAESCKNGLKIPIRVRPRLTEPISMKPLARSEKAALAEAPLAPSPMPSGGDVFGDRAAQALLGLLFLIFII